MPKIECYLGTQEKNIGIEIMKTLTELMRCVIRQSYVTDSGDVKYYNPPGVDLPIELYDYKRELYHTCVEYIAPDNMLTKKGRKRHFVIGCQNRSLCAAVLWKKVKSLGLQMTIDEFSNRCGVSKATNINVYNQLNNK